MSTADGSEPPDGAPAGGARYATIDHCHSCEPAAVKRRLTVILALAVALAAVCVLTWRIAWQRGIEDLQQQAAVRADRTASALTDTLDRYESLSYLLASHPIVEEALETSSAGSRERANRYLEDANRHAHATVTYVIRNDGWCVAASNWESPDTFVGSNYQFRPYFIDAMKGGVGRFFGIGTVSHVPGYFISEPVRREGRMVGVAVVKVNLEWFPGTDSGEPLLVTDKHGVIFLSSVPAWKYRAIAPVPASVSTAIFETRQYAGRPIVPLPIVELRTLDGGARIVRVGDPRAGTRYLATRRTLSGPDWHLVTLSSIDPVFADARNATAAVGFGFASLCLLAFYWRTRQARLREMMRSRAMLQNAYAELNQRVAERTADLSAANARLQTEVSERTRAESELRAAHDELVQTSKLAALGQMAAGITHELNQPLAALRAFSDNTRVLLERGDQNAARENLEAISALTERMGKITNQLKLFVGRAQPRTARAPVARAVCNALNLLQKRLQAVALEVTIHDSETASGAGREALDVSVEHPGLVAYCDDLRLEQALINLIGNALDAVSGVESPRIGIDIDASYATLSVTVRDNGPGIPEDVLPRLFEPFFTTKGMGQGLGLGLAIASSIARDCGGALSASNEPGGGAAFVLKLRRALAPSAQSEVPSK
ncbi:ATP-binding protein [Trinickia caryophylli]|uniref:C4-dicarboxylate transport sensor protein DctB n=1 Tax=Trinickia caryophylli TaxID=28094 RepID=A0A1X7EP17_TRICW|nr:ATP-binding protein [Trinickia caryophylli]PMS10252.1 sensor histidine kinase [Trinickia caryophylli]TRX18722.1 sensor histidine kinase [Trinickia caryophylli]WQE10482.1 ATP-binding protein [Trinickia caryophylli]SMF37349.1 histidine kinase [Trinickia caryophylli]GLU32833.1 two-component sensor histidine kinase [Trinickia caryophylli]